jgi:2'-5' RNA ligase
VGDELTRSFVAVLLPEPVRARLGEAVATLSARAPRLGWVRPENLHLTLRFLGGLDAAGVAAAGDAVRRAAAGRAPFRLGLGGLGGFPSARAPRVVWAGVTAGAAALAGLQGALEAELTARGFPPEMRAFHAHVTLGRARDPRQARGLEALLGSAAGFGELTVAAVHLMRSDLGRGGARYDVLLEAALDGGTPPGA